VNLVGSLRSQSLITLLTDQQQWFVTGAAVALLALLCVSSPVADVDNVGNG
jgi:hypothetical protein